MDRYQFVEKILGQIKEAEEKLEDLKSQCKGAEKRTPKYLMELLNGGGKPEGNQLINGTKIITSTIRSGFFEAVVMAEGQLSDNHKVTDEDIVGHCARLKELQKEIDMETARLEGLKACDVATELKSILEDL